MPAGKDEEEHHVAAEDGSAGHRHRFAKRIGGLIGILAALAGIIGLVITVMDRPEPLKAEDWASEANAACEREIGALTSATLNAQTALLTVQTNIQAGTLTDQQVKDAAWYFDSAAGALRKINGELRRIKRPGEIENEVDEVIDKGVELSNVMSRVAVNLSQVSLSEPARSLELLGAANTEIQKADPLLSQWQEGLQALDVTSCDT
ncbi:hypothetical protein [Streptomyces sp. NPDC018833]|uniref:hypothetical protein n=1 Tax=Streptomyces sp. NPDC018833 TaxID=3365053 RepID=UPI0037A505D1